MRRRLITMDAASQPETFETNQRFEDHQGTLKANHKLLRLRRDTTCRLTYKSKPARTDSECKVYRELEVEVSDFKTMQSILNALGYRAVQIYEKRRQVFQWNGVSLCLDTMPYGAFLEIEGSEKRIKATARQLDLPWEKRILDNYLAIFEVLREHYHLPFHDVTFANFEAHPADFIPLLERFEFKTRDGQR